MVQRPESESRPKRRPPPNYFSRRVQTRLLLLVGAFMLVIFLMEESRKPKYYLWMWGKQGAEQTGDASQPSDGDVDTRIEIPPSGKLSEPLPGSFDTAKPEYDEDTLAQAGATRADDPVARASIDAWGRMLGELSLEQRNTFDEALLSYRRGDVIAQDDLDILVRTNQVLETELGKYVDSARESLIDNELLSEQEIAAWQSVLDQLEAAWQKRWQPALAQLGLSVDTPVAELDEIQAVIDELNLAAVRDNTLARPPERHAWIRFVERLQTTPADDLKEQSIGVVGFLQLHDQPKDYRGQVVTIRGHARLGYRVTARKNPLGVKEYRLLWLRPRGGPNTLIAIYCLETPDLPPLKHKDKDRDVTPLDHEVQVTGYFFKKWAYRARDGLRTAPQLLAKSVVVESAPVWNRSQPPSNQMLLFVVVAAALGGVGLAVVFYVLNQWPSRAAQVVTHTKEKIDAIDPQEVSRGVANELKDLEESERLAESEQDETPPSDDEQD